MVGFWHKLKLGKSKYSMHYAYSNYPARSPYGRPPLQTLKGNAWREFPFEHEGVARSAGVVEFSKPKFPPAFSVKLPHG